MTNPAVAVVVGQCMTDCPLLVDFLAEIRMRGEMENGGLAKVGDLRQSSRPAAEDNSLTATLQRGLENIFNAVVYSDSDESLGDSGPESGDSWDEEAEAEDGC